MKRTDRLSASEGFVRARCMLERLLGQQRDNRVQRGIDVGDAIEMRRDNLSRLLSGLRLSLFLASAGAAVSCVLALFLGALSGL